MLVDVTNLYVNSLSRAEARRLAFAAAGRHLGVHVVRTRGARGPRPGLQILYRVRRRPPRQLLLYLG